MYYSKNSPKFILECQASKTLALKWFQDWKKFQTIQLGKTYAQALLLGKKLDPVRGDLRMKQNIPNQVPVTARSDRGSQQNKNKLLVHRQVSQVKLSDHGSSVTGIPQAPQIQVQIELKNRFQILQDTADHEIFHDQGVHSFQVTNKHAKVHKENKVAFIATYKKYPERKLESLKNHHCNSSQETVNTDSVSQNVNNQQPVDDVIDLNSHVANCHLLINGNCEPDNRITLENSPKNVENIIGDCNNLGMCVEKQKCIAQTGGYFGFVPETSFKLYQGPPVYWQDIPTILEAHALVQTSGTHNYLNCRIPVNSHLNIDKWVYHLRDYWDQQIVDLLHYGFPLDFNRKSPLISTHINHSSALADIEHVRQYVEEELQHEAIIGPFDFLSDNITCSVDTISTKKHAKTTKTSGELYNSIVSQKFVPPKSHTYFKILFNLNNFDFSSCYKIKVQQIPDKKICDFNFKLLSNILACRKKLFKWQVIQSKNCMLCNSVETIEHLLFTCPVKLEIWNRVCTCLNVRFDVKTLVLGVLNFNTDWAISVVTLCIYKYWSWSNDAISDEVSLATYIRNLKLNLKNYITIYKVCNFDDVSKKLEIIYSTILTL